MTTYGPPAPDATQLFGQMMLKQEDQAQRQRRMALASALMGANASPGGGAAAGLVSGLSKGMGTALFYKTLAEGRDQGGQQSRGFDWDKGFGEAQFGPDKIGFRDSIRGLFGLPK